MKQIIQFLRDEDGPTAVEYAVMLAMILVAALSGISFFGQSTASSFSDSRTAIENAMNSGS